MEVIAIGERSLAIPEAGGPPVLVISAIRNNRGWLVRANHPDDTLETMLAECRRLEAGAGHVRVARRSRRGKEVG